MITREYFYSVVTTEKKDVVIHFHEWDGHQSRLLLDMIFMGKPIFFRFWRKKSQEQWLEKTQTEALKLGQKMIDDGYSGF